jgi:hypothetical protein
MLILSETEIESMVIDLCIKYSHKRCNNLVVEKILKVWNQKDLMRVISEIGGVFGVSLLQMRVTFDGGYFFDPVNECASQARIEISHPFKKHHLIYKHSKMELFRGGLPIFVFMTAHEMAHIRLHTDNHPLRLSEPATDIMALVMGFDGAFESIINENYDQFGYLARRQIPFVLAQVRERVNVTYIHN